MDNVAKAIDPLAKQSTLSTNLLNSVNAIKILRKKIKMLIDIFENSGVVRQNPSFARRLNQIAS